MGDPIPMEMEEDESNDNDLVVDDEFDFTYIRERASNLWSQLNDEQRGWWNERAQFVIERHILGILRRLTAWISTSENIKNAFERILFACIKNLKA